MRGKLKIGKSRLYLPKNEGGLELFKLDDFLGAQCCAWVKRSLFGDDIWKKTLRAAGFGNAYNIRKHRINKKTNPILHYIAECYEKFLFKLGSIAENYRKMSIFENPLFCFDGAGGGSLTKNFFRWMNLQDQKT